MGSNELRFVLETNKYRQPSSLLSVQLNSLRPLALGVSGGV